MCERGELRAARRRAIRMESMKMESGIASPVDGLVEKILVQRRPDSGDR